MASSPYRVLARKYRPQDFDDLVGQEVLVRTLSNAIESGRIAQAFLLTGIRGIGKTTTARIIARALNCIGPDGQGGQTIHPCGVCSNCRMIAEDRHVDVLELDAASNGGIDKIRELIDRVHYAPSAARYKVYIIDEVHMLHINAFNALLKTLEEPPPSVIFILATTELKKIPVTILSRCQRFDLKRLSSDRLAEHLTNICGREAIGAEPEALELIAAVAEGSVRDGLSLLDRAIAHGGGAGDLLRAEDVRAMLGLADRSQSFALLESIFGGETATALDRLRKQYDDGAEMTMLVSELLGLVHVLSRLKIAPAGDLGAGYSEHERGLAGALAESLAVPELSRAWQMLLKGLDEIRRAPDPVAAAEMVVIRLCHAARLPLPGDLVREWVDSPGREHGPARGPSSGGQASTGAVSSGAVSTAALNVPRESRGGAAQPARIASMRSEPQASVAATPRPHLSLAAHNPPRTLADFDALAALLEANGEMILLSEFSTQVEPVELAGECLRVHFLPGTRPDFAARLKRVLDEATRGNWRIEPLAERGRPTRAASRAAGERERQARLLAHPNVAAILEAFPGARVVGPGFPRA